jgi:lipopolysaccharide/colanic/teichoic acid biosynthesis glycosyltransferase
MIILGDCHTFDEREQARIASAFPTIDRIHYRDSDPQTVIDAIETHLDISTAKSLILLNTAARIPDTLLSYLTRLESRGIRYIGLENFFETYLNKCYIPEDQTNIDFLATVKPYSVANQTLKTLADYIVSIPLALFASPLMLYAAYQIRRESPGSVLFRQTRIGKNGHPFTCYKFRTMHENSHHDPYTRENDPRIFSWGETMRKTRIDELPQLWNILRGEMHLLGPRAEWDILVEGYETEIPYYQLRHIVRPGITGWAQVNYPYGANAEDARQKLMYDLYYIKYWSPWLEIKTIWITVMVVLGKQGV